MGALPKLECKDWILIFLRLNDNEVIRGRLMFIKLLFIANKEVLNNEIDGIFQFYPDKHGPYSRAFPKCIENLKQEQLITEKTYKTDFTMTYEYEITPKGINSINSKLQLLNEELTNRLKSLKSAFISQGYTKVLRYVYLNYPEYTTASIIRDDVRNATDFTTD